MQVGIGLPNAVPGTDGRLLIEWARRADAGPFSSLGVLDRIAYDSYDPLTALAAAAAVTRRVRLVTMIVVGPLRSTALLAKAAASVDALSGGRLVLGLSVGARQEDYEAAGVEYHSRGRRLSEQLATLRSCWEDGTMGPGTARSGGPPPQPAGTPAVQAAPPQPAGTPAVQAGPPLLVGGLSDQSFARMARYADGYVHGGGPPRAFARAADKARAAWSDAERPGTPQLWGQGYFALGAEAVEAGTAYLREYYAFTGAFAETVAAELLTTPQAIVQFLRGYEEAGCDELILLPTVPDLAQLDLLAAVLYGSERYATNPLSVGR